MKNTLVMLFYKLRKTPLFFILLVFSFVVINAYLLFAAYIFNGLSAGTVESIAGTIGTTWIYSIFFVNTFVGNEFSNRTMKNILSSGSNRIKTYFSYMLVCEFVVFLYYIVQTFSGLLIGSIFIEEPLNGSAVFSQSLSSLAVLFILTAAMVTYHFMAQKGGTSFGFALLLIEGIILPVIKSLNNTANYFSITFYANVWQSIEPSRFPSLGALLVLIGLFFLICIAGVYYFTKEDIDI